jgi:hypothetical protein
MVSLKYTMIEDTTSGYRYDDDVLFFKYDKTAPVKISRKAYKEMSALDEEKLSQYIFNNFEQKDLWLVRKAMDFGKNVKFVFFDMAPPKPRKWKEPEINSYIKAALRRERVRIHGDVT